ncbi:hypothetical protein QR680_006495 [Steinernema hermaphroditum]|uniref:glucuronosyltransferase n=1 Tax=Steinernema hermaphroditum TaxID=289476 RepID=A0AA39HVN6_9BILA|nr:hypothetical protein QR680_006495 [Steinernema hermaphroditum]
MKSLLFLSLLFGASLGYKILVYSPRAGQSHVNFLGRISDILIEEGHNVTVVLPIVGERAPSNGTKLAKTIVIDRNSECISVSQRFDEDMWNDHGFFEKARVLHRLVVMHECQCRRTLGEDALIEELIEENFDLGISEAFDLCGMPFFHEIGIKKHVLVSSMMLIEWVAAMFGAPNLPSLVPASFGALSNSMTYTQRIENILDVWMGDNFFDEMTMSIQKVADAKHGRKVMDVKEKLTEATFVITNSDPLIDFPRPISERIVNIGGISVPPAKPLDPYWTEVLNRRRRTVLFSFGSVAKSVSMPAEVKKSILETFSRFPDTTFIWKYENEEENVAKDYPNVITSKWIPQNNLLNSPKLVMFITHSGMASTLETSARGVPMLCIPLFGDQMRNAKMVETMGTGKSLKKKVLFNSDEFEAHIRDVLEDSSYHEKAKRLALMIKHRARNQRETLVRYVEFAARFGGMPEKRMPELGYIQYYLLDIIVPALVIVLAVMMSLVYFTYRLTKWIIAFYKKTVKTKQA